MFIYDVRFWPTLQITSHECNTQVLSHRTASKPQVQVAPVPVMLAPKQQVQVVVQVTATAPFQGAPDLLLDYKMGSTVVHQVCVCCCHAIVCVGTSVQQNSEARTQDT
jgi:hypothetical protein